MTPPRLHLLASLGLCAALGLSPVCKPSTGSTDHDGGDGAPADGDADVDGDADADRDLDLPEGWPDVCDEDTFEIVRVVPDMLVVLDRSNSMQELGHWTPVREAIYAVTEALEARVWFGLMVFPNVEEPDACVDLENQCVEGRAPVVECGEDRAGAIRTALEPMEPCGGTPIGSTLSAARSYLAGLAASTGHPSYVVLATDGAPNCNPTLDGETCTCTAPVGCVPNVLNCLDDERTYGIIDGLRESGVGVFVIGITASEWRAVLDEMAARGGTGSAVMAEDPASIREAFETITGMVMTCEFEIGAPDPSADPELVNFYFDDIPVPHDADETCDAGWAWADPEHTRVRFCGEHCDRLRSHAVTEVRATFGCPTVM